MKKEIKNLPTSVHDRLNGLARQAGRPFQEFFYYFAIERFLYRLSKSKYGPRFILKGGLMFFGWGIHLRRPTRDIDLQGDFPESVDDLAAAVKEICLQEVDPDGMSFDPTSVRGRQIIGEANYPGIRIYFTGYLGQASIYLHMDVSFDNVITPGEILVQYPTLLNMPGFTIRGYPIESSIAEKLQAMVILQDINDRMKDFYDIWLLSQQVEITGMTLLDAIKATFKSRRTALPPNLPTALTDDFAKTRQSDWGRFLHRSLLSDTHSLSFSSVIETLRQFLWPVMQAASRNTPFAFLWKAGGPWQEVK